MLYAIAGTVWIVASDSVLEALVPDPATRQELQTVKGILFVALSAALVGFLAYRELRRAEEQRSQLVAMIDQNVAGLYVLQGEHVLAVNQRLADVLGYPVDDLVGRKVLDFVAEEDRTTLAARVAGGEGEQEPMRLTCLHRDGSRVRVELQSRLVEWEGRPTRVGVLLDVTEEERRQAHMARAQRLEAMGQLTSAVAHDFKNLLTTILAPLEMTRAQIPDTHPARRDLDEAHEGALRAATLTRRLLEFSRQRPYTPAPTDLSELVAKAEPLLRHALGPAVRLELALADDLPPVAVDRSTMEQVLLNLAVNAAEAMNGRGAVVVGTSVVRVGGGRPDEVVLEITDEGPGLELEAAEHLFEPFFTTKTEGTGLGLATVQRIVRQAGGTVRVDSRKGQGATFTIAFPATGGTATRLGSLEMEESPSSLAWPRSATVLVVDDDEAVRGVTTRVLERYGFDVLSASHGAEARSIVERHPTAVDLLLCDVGLPDVDGASFAMQLAQGRPGLRVVLMSGAAEQQQARSLRARAGHRFLEKPFKINELVQEAHAALQSRNDGAGLGGTA